MGEKWIFTGLLKFSSVLSHPFAIPLVVTQEDELSNSSNFSMNLKEMFNLLKGISSCSFFSWSVQWDSRLFLYQHPYFLLHCSPHSSMDLQGCTKQFPLQPRIDRNRQLCRHTLSAESPCSPAMVVVLQEGQEWVMTSFTLWTVSLAILGSLSPCLAAAPQPTRWHSGCTVQAPASKFTCLVSPPAEPVWRASAAALPLLCQFNCPAGAQSTCPKEVPDFRKGSELWSSPRGYHQQQKCVLYSRGVCASLQLPDPEPSLLPR